jgi:hypothetical protein
MLIIQFFLWIVRMARDYGPFKRSKKKKKYENGTIKGT